MALEYYSELPLELKERIVRNHMQEERKKEFLDKSIEASCMRYQSLLKKEVLSSSEISELCDFLIPLAQYCSDRCGTRCLLRWKKDVPVNVKYFVMEEQHFQLYGPLDMDGLSCFEILLPEVDDDVTYEDGKIVNCKELDLLFTELGITVLYITITDGRIITPLPK
ncbi:cell cycle link protein [Pea yellow stunt virus]|uniref:Cell cycle link protein n=1 Tax=Pea yellow stunt virus TaxID=1436892 RepID=V9TSV6_9VIRU|nr:cell cycle link protein [Pea yellow stunt virus]AHC72283.1 cell cycle link protein [Pea yellow stunt virus]